MAIPEINIELNSLGLSEDEARVYVALLELNRAYVSVIAKRAHVPRVNCYHLLESLARQGMATCLMRGGKKIYAKDYGFKCFPIKKYYNKKTTKR